ncbi:excinuclease ABC subunit UvrB [bacterium]|nr:excinuclease ABC subunit UvrB [bacterium]
MKEFELVSEYKPSTDQARAIEQISANVLKGTKHQTLLGVTGSGKTFTIANVIQKLRKPTLVISHNKTLAAQLYGEFKSFFPRNAVEYFISYYDYYQPEAYIPSTDTFIEKDTQINEDIDRLRLKATASLLERRDVVIIASVSCIYGLGSPADYRELLVTIKINEGPSREKLISKLVDIHYLRNEIDFHHGTFRVRGDVVEIYPAYEDKVIRVEYFGFKPESIKIIHPLTGEILGEQKSASIYPARHFVTSHPNLKRAAKSIREELIEQLKQFESENKLLEMQRLETRTNFDLEMMLEIGYCSGIENYSRHIAAREPGSRPWVLLDFFPPDFLVIIDESHMTLPQLHGMFAGDRSRKLTLIEHGFRLPSALDNRPLYFEEFMEIAPQLVYMSATPGDWELEISKPHIVEQLTRPTGLVDPVLIIKPSTGQVEDLIGEINNRVKKGERVLVTTLTKRMSEDLTEYLADLDIRVRYLHSEIDALDRVEIIRGLRLGEFDVLVGINLLREGLDLPEVSLVAILDADKQGFLRSHRALIQTAGRAARHSAGEVILYADKISDAMASAITETERRRKIQLDYNKKHNITPTSIVKSTESIMNITAIADSQEKFKTKPADLPQYVQNLPVEEQIEELTRIMEEEAKKLNFEYAAFLRDNIKDLREYKNTHDRKPKKPKWYDKKLTRFY